MTYREIKAIEELMIGDWVIAYVDDDKHYVQVINIRENCIRFKEIGTNIIADMPYGYLYPIPITSEILRKNGFDKKRLSGYDCHFSYVLYYESMNFELTALNDCEFSFIINNVAKKIEYVHELQHVLKICGINKEIKL